MLKVDWLTYFSLVEDLVEINWAFLACLGKTKLLDG